MSASTKDRRKFPRIQAPVFCRPARFKIMHRAIDVSLGGARVYADDETEIGEELKLEMFLPGGGSVDFTCRVRWIDRLGPDAPARFDVGLEFVDANDDARRALAAALAADPNALPPGRPSDED